MPVPAQSSLATSPMTMTTTKRIHHSLESISGPWIKASNTIRVSHCTNQYRSYKPLFDCPFRLYSDQRLQVSVALSLNREHLLLIIRTYKTWFYGLYINTARNIIIDSCTIADSAVGILPFVMGPASKSSYSRDRHTKQDLPFSFRPLTRSRGQYYYHPKLHDHRRDHTNRLQRCTRYDLCQCNQWSYSYTYGGRPSI
jgi:hypothetical protein